eukprot:CAMPEP_0175897956 /NCGR_PEP_ID=MMETSP0108-20121206/999_1 /TAXON_ID=195067 ORGANISM="Goniomonas pacifica, Strain CCMP1869" /NCGR_SAMPLE_ID=MMETSP0108 /ASSEMBLY_ACC=CAM_ASM_000204 /LENGTH=181 /DNA_ID=CAMNT_0017219295 /DNA_START=92 /DNA_END=640 /DNA_ORIENTATION=+
MSSLASHDEDFEVFGPDNTSLGRTEKRAVVHEQGLFHRAVQVLLRNTDGSIGLQKRHEQKDVAPGLWDLSCAEHVQPGESYEAAARRGLLEELGVVDPPPLRQLHAAFLQENEYPALGKIDREFVEVWSLPRFEGEVKIDGVEVVEWRWVKREDLEQELSLQPGTFCPWVRDTLDRIRSVL